MNTCIQWIDDLHSSKAFSVHAATVPYRYRYPFIQSKEYCISVEFHGKFRLGGATATLD